MSLLPTDLTSFIWGLLIGAAAIFLHGFVSKFGEDAADAVKRRIFPKPSEPPLRPQPVEVDKSFLPPVCQGGSCIGVRELQTGEKEAQGYTFYLDPDDAAKRYRVVGMGNGTTLNEYLMLRNDA